MKKFTIGVLIILALFLSACTQSKVAKNYGGKMRVELKPNTKLVNVTWKETDLWMLTRPMKPEESAEVYLFYEKSTYGVMQGEITIVEIKQ